MSYVADCCRVQDKLGEAEGLDRKILEQRKRVLGSEDPQTLKSMHALAASLFRQAKYDEAEMLLRETLEIRKRVLGLQHQDTLSSMSDLGVAYTEQGKYSEAEPDRKSVV